MSWIWLVVLGVGVLQLPLLVDLLLALIPNANIRRLTQQSTSYFLIAVLLGICAVALSYFYTRVFARLSFLPITHSALLTYAWILTVWNYAYACLIKPPLEDQRLRRAKDFDHYCPFTMNVVFRDNFRYFLGFLLLATIGLVDACFLTWEPFRLTWLADHGSEGPFRAEVDGNADSGGLHPSASTPSWMSEASTVDLFDATIFLPCAALVGATGGLFICQVWLFFVNKTTAEFFQEASDPGRGLWHAAFARAPFTNPHHSSEVDSVSSSASSNRQRSLNPSAMSKGNQQISPLKPSKYYRMITTQAPHGILSVFLPPPLLPMKTFARKDPAQEKSKEL